MPLGYGADPAGTHLEVYPCAYGNPGGDNQEFYIKTVTYIGYNYTEIVNLKNSLCLDVSGWASDNSDLANNLPLTLYPCYDPSWDFGGYDDHMWELYNAN